MTKKRGIDRGEAFQFAIILGTFSLIPGLLNIKHWYETGFNLSSYHPIVPFFGLASATCAIVLLLFTTKGYVTLTTIPYFFSLAYNILQIYGIFKTYPEYYNILLLALIITIVGTFTFIWSVVKD